MNIETSLWLLVIGVGFVLGRLYLPAYFGQKGKNAADKEDVAHITALVEQVKSDYAFLQEHFKANQQLRMAAVERRLQAHQEAFSHWQRVIATVHHKDLITEVCRDCSHWWSENCLYLGADVRIAFLKSFTSAQDHWRLIEQGGAEQKDVAAITENWTRVTAVGDLIMGAVSLPPLSQVEKEALPRLID